MTSHPKVTLPLLSGQRGVLELYDCHRNPMGSAQAHLADCTISADFSLDPVDVVGRGGPVWWCLFLPQGAPQYQQLDGLNGELCDESQQRILQVVAEAKLDWSQKLSIHLDLFLERLL